MKIMIANQKWTIEKVPPHDPSLFVEGDEALGTTWLGHTRICIAGDLSEDRARRTIRHELCHAYINATQANRPETWDEEAICDFMAIYGPEISEVAKKVFEALFLVDSDLCKDRG